jgi:hypothetical protein
MKEAAARIKINKLLENAGWRFFADANGPANIQLESSVALKKQDLDAKGGIKPHKRFSIQAKRSEVLFVDYMAEHLTPTGRAGIIVPEGIIFQSQGAYKELRKMLVENSLVAVVSLPAGCFNLRVGSPAPRHREERPPASPGRTRRLPPRSPLR